MMGALNEPEVLVMMGDALGKQVGFLGFCLGFLALCATSALADGPAGEGAPALTVTSEQARLEDWPLLVNANGSLAPWQEAVIAAETGGLRVVRIAVDVGSQVKRGEVLAELAQDTVLADVALQQARVAQAEAALSEARANGARARELSGKASMSEQQTKQYLVAEESARANLAAAQAQLKSQQIRLEQTQVRAPDDGSIASRSATLGSVVQAGSELFRLVRQNRVEWRAEVTAEQLALVQPGQPVQVRLPDGGAVAGRVRVAAPTFDPVTRLALVYVDLPEPGNARAGLFARGEIQVGSAPARTLPEAALVVRDGNVFLFEIDSDQHLIQHKVITGRRLGGRVEIRTGLPDGAAVVASGGAFLNDGDRVRVAAGPAGGH